MAEAFGVFAASAQLLGLAVGSIVKAKRLWDEIDQAPSEIQDLMLEIQALGPVLANLQTLHHHEHEKEGVNVTPSVECYYNAHTALDDLVRSLSKEVSETRGFLRRKALATKIVLRKSSIRHLEAKLRSARNVLELSLSISSLHWIRRSYELNIETRSLLHDMRYGDNDGDGTSGGAERTVARRQISVARSFGNIAITSNDSVSTVTIHLPHWLTGAVWRIWIRKPFWDLHFRQYNIRSDEAEIFVSVRGGDVEKMLHLFERRDASPFDRDANSRSLLYYAAAFNQPTICKRLLEMGLDECVDENPGNGVTPREAAYLRSLRPTDDGKGHRDVVELLLNPARSFPEPNDCRFLLHWCASGPVDVAAVSQFQQEVAPNYFNLPLEQRLQAARAYCLSGCCPRHPDATVFTFLIGRDIDIDRGLDTNNGYSLVHSIAIALGRVHREAMNRVTGCNAEREVRWFLLLSRVLERGQPALHIVEHVGHQYSIDAGNLACKGDWVGTPLLSMLRGSVAQAFLVSNTKYEPFKKQWGKWQSVLAYTLGCWLAELMELGVDLEMYGRREREILFSTAEERLAALDFKWVVSFWWSASIETMVTTDLPVRLCRLIFGARPSEWSMEWEIDVELMSGEFWGAVEGEIVVHTRVPGQWVD